MSAATTKRGDQVCRQRWLEERKGGLGGSDAATILGLNPWCSPYTLFLEKTGLIESAEEENEPMEWGRKLEPVVASHYQEKTGRELRLGTPMQWSRERPHLFANVDRLIEPVAGRPGRGVYEGKTTSAFQAEQWRDGEIPLYYQVQVQAYLYVLELEWGSVACLIGGQRFVWTDVGRNDRFIRAYVKQADEFWRRVQENDPPPMEGHPSEKRALEVLYKRPEEGKVIELPDEALVWAEKLEEANAAKAQAWKEKERYETLLRGVMGDALYGVLPDGSGFKLGLEHRKEHVRKASSTRVLRKVKRVPL